MLIVFIAASCKKSDNPRKEVMVKNITIENVLEAKPLVESGRFQNTGDVPVILPDESISFQFYAAPGQALSFVSMYGWSNDLFFAPSNPGIQLYEMDGTPIEGDVSTFVKLWDNGTRINEAPGEMLVHPGMAEDTPKPVTEVVGVDEQGNMYAAASEMLKVNLKYEGNSMFTVSIENTSGNTDNPTPFSPGVWAISYIADGSLLNPSPLFEPMKLSTDDLTLLAETGDNSELGIRVSNHTVIFTPFSPVLVVIYRDIENPLFKVGGSRSWSGIKRTSTDRRCF